MSARISLVDAFVAPGYLGNPAAVCWGLPDAIPDQAGLQALDGVFVGWMQALASEMNQSETAFVAPSQDSFALRWFTLESEVDLCGHATLAAAHTLWEEGLANSASQIQFHTRSGLLTVVRVEDRLEMSFPSQPVSELTQADSMDELFGVAPVSAWKNDMDWMLVFDSEQTITSLTPNMEALKTLPARGVICTAEGSASEVDFVSRFFAPGVGIPEDPVTGSAHCALAPYWGDVLGLTRMTGVQLSKRGGIVQTRLEGNRVILGGQSKTVLRGRLLS